MKASGFPHIYRAAALWRFRSPAPQKATVTCGTPATKRNLCYKFTLSESYCVTIPKPRCLEPLLPCTSHFSISQTRRDLPTSIFRSQLTYIHLLQRDLQQLLQEVILYLTSTPKPYMKLFLNSTAPSGYFGGKQRERAAEATSPAANPFRPFPCLQFYAPEQFTHCRQ